MSGGPTAWVGPKLPPSVGPCRQVSGLESRLSDEITVGGIKYSDSLQAEELLLFKQASPSTQQGRPHQPRTLGISACEM